MHRLLLALVAAAVLAEPLGAQGASEFRAGRLADIIARHRATVLEGVPAEGTELVFAADTEPTAVEARYAGRARPIGADRREFIAAWAESRGLDPRWAASFSEEWLFRADSGEYWLAVQGTTAESMRRSVRPGSPITLNTRWLGARVVRGRPQWVFVLISATSDEDDGDGGGRT